METGRGEQEANAAELSARFEQEALPEINFLYNGALRFTRDPQDAWDLVQETMSKAFGAFDKFQAGTNIRGWLYRIMQNAFITNYRKTKRQPNFSSVDELEDWQLSMLEAAANTATPSAESLAIASLPDKEVRDALLALPEQFRTAVFLADAEGFTYAEIADILKVPIGTVMSRISRGRKALRESLNEVARNRGLGG